MTPTPTPDPTMTPDPSAVTAVQFVPEQWQYIAVALCIVVFAVGVLLAVKA